MRRCWWAGLLLGACGGGPDTATSTATSASTIECGAGTVADGDTCVPDPSACGDGTKLVGGACIALPRYALRAPRMIRADGRSAVIVRAFGLDPANQASHESVIVTVDRASAGTVVSPNLWLDDVGAGTNFIPCQGQLATCLGPARLSLALASAPQTPLATADIVLVAPPQIGSMTPCLTGGNVLYLDGTSWFYDSPVTFSSQAVFNVDGAPDWVAMHIVVPNNGPVFTLGFSSQQLGIPLIPSVYEDGIRPITTKRGQIGFELYASGTPLPAPVGCGEPGDFQIHSITAGMTTTPPTQNDVMAIDVSFTIDCEFDPTKRITGCVHYSD